MQRKVGTIASSHRSGREEALTLFHEVRRREGEQKSNAIHPLPPHDVDLGGPLDSSMQNPVASSVAKMRLSYLRGGVIVMDDTPLGLNVTSDDLLSAELGKNDYDWLLTPPGTPLNNRSHNNSASDYCDFLLSQGESLDLVQSLAAIKTSRVVSTITEPNSMEDITTVPTSSEVTPQKGHNGASRSNGVPTNNRTAPSLKKTPLTPRSASVSRPASPATGTLLASAHKSNPSTPASKNKPSSAPRSHPTTPTNRYLTPKGEGNSVFSSLTPTRKTAPASPAFTSIKRSSLSSTHQPLSAGVSRSSSVSKVRPQPSRSAPSSRGSSPIGNPPLDWQQAFSTNSQSASSSTINSGPSNLSMPTSLDLKASNVASSPRRGGRSSTRHALFPSSNQLETFMDIPKRACSSSFTRGKCALLKMDKQTSLGSIMSRSSIQLDKSEGDSVTASIKMENKMIHNGQSLGSSGVGIQVTHSQGKYVPSVSNEDNRFSRQASRGSLDTAMDRLSLHRDMPNGFYPLVASKPDHSSARNVVAQDRVHATDYRMAKADVSITASYGQGGKQQAEEFKHCSDFKLLLADQTDILSSFLKDDNMGNWLDSPVYMNEGPDLMKTFEQGSGKLGNRESALMCPHGGGTGTCDLCNVKMRLQMLNEKSKASFGANSQILSEA